jgi:hypothetical protein
VLELFFSNEKVIEVLFNNEIQVFSFQFHLHFWKKTNIVVYIIENVLRLNHVIWTKYQSDIKY